jgi:hypothetical protein
MGMYHMNNKRMTVERVAEICHDLNRKWCEMNGDFSQLVWIMAPKWQKDSAIAGVKFIINNPDATNEESHNSWYNQKVIDGWVYGEVKDPEKKTHPCMVPYDDLPQFQKMKDQLFRQTVKSFFEVYKDELSLYIE